MVNFPSFSICQLVLRETDLIPLHRTCDAECKMRYLCSTPLISCINSHVFDVFLIWLGARWTLQFLPYFNSFLQSAFFVVAKYQLRSFKISQLSILEISLNLYDDPFPCSDQNGPKPAILSSLLIDEQSIILPK